MATKTSVVMDTVDQAHKKSSRSITYIDPNASNSDIKDFIQGLNGLTHQTLAAARRVDSTDIINDTKLSRNLVLNPATITGADISTNIDSPTEITLSGNALASEDLIVSKPNENERYLYVDWTLTDSNIYINLIKENSTLSASEIVFKLPETDTYQAASVKLTITAG